MKALLLGVGLQGRAALHDLVQSAAVAHVTAADQDVQSLAALVADRGYGNKVTCRPVDVTDRQSLDRLFAAGYDVAVDLTPSRLSPMVAAVALRHRVHLVNTVYVLPEMKKLAQEAETAGITILPEFGMDPGIDLVLLSQAVRGLDIVQEVWSYGAGIPEPAAANDVLRYKVTWTFEGVLRSYARPVRMRQEGTNVDIPAGRIFHPENIHETTIPGLGKLEAFPNGDALKYAEYLGLDMSRLRHLGRYALRWPGHCAFWRVMADLQLLDEDEIVVDGVPVNKRRFLARAIEPHIRLGANERDLAILRIVVRGEKGGRKCKQVFQVIDRRDLKTGLTAMNRCVGYTASIGAQMIADGRINKRGLLSPVHDVPYEPFVAELKRREINVTVQAE